VAAMALLLSGCARQSARGPVQLVVGCDASGSNRAALPVQVRMISRMTRRFTPGVDRLTLVRLDHEATEFYDGNVPASGDRLRSVLVQALSARATRPGTRPDRFWEAAAELAEASSAPVVVVLCGDGEMDDRGAEAVRRLTASVTRLARCPRVRRVAVWGVKPETRAALRRSLRALGDRLEIRGVEDVDPASFAAAVE
jgi:hypothetical protein